MEFRTALPQEAEKIYSLYQSVLGGPFCVWDTEYPGPQDIQQDLANNGLYVLEEDGALLGAISIVAENELDDQPCWRCRNAREIVRVAVAPQAQGRGLAGVMVRQILEILQEQGYEAVHLAAAKQNVPACKTYEKAGFIQAGEAHLFGHPYNLMEKMLESGR